MARLQLKDENKKTVPIPRTVTVAKPVVQQPVTQPAQQPVATSDVGIIDAFGRPPVTVTEPRVDIPRTDIPQMVPTGPTLAQMQAMLAQKRERARIAELEKARQASLSVLRAEEETIEPQFAEARRQTRATSARGAQQFADFLASRGLTAAGGAALGETRRLGALQGALGGLAQQETAALSDIARRRTGIETGFAADVEAARAGIQAEAMQTAIEQQRLDEAARVQAQQQGFQNALALAQFNEGVRQFDAQTDLKTKQFEAATDLDLRKQTFDEAQQRIDNAIRQGQLSIQQGNLLLNKKRFEAQQDPNSLDNQLIQANIADVQARTAGRISETAQPDLTPTAYKTDPDYAVDLAQIINATPDQKTILLQQLQSNAQAFISKYGVDGYNALLKEAQGF